MAEEMVFVMKVKLPSSGAYHSSPSGDTEYESAFREAIFAVKPEGFEVCWPRANEKWPVDAQGFTWVPLWVGDAKNGLAVTLSELNDARKQLRSIRETLKTLI